MHYISETILQQNELLLSNIAKKYVPFAQYLISQYNSDHPFYSITKQYRNDTAKLKEEIKNALLNRKMYILHILKEFRSIK